MGRLFCITVSTSPIYIYIYVRVCMCVYTRECIHVYIVYKCVCVNVYLSITRKLHRIMWLPR